VSSIMDAKPALGAVLQHAAPLAVSPEKIVLAFPRGSFFGRQAEALDGRQGIARAAARVLGAEPSVEVTYADAAGEGVKTLVEAEKERRDARIEETRKEALSHPLVLEAAQLFSVAPERMSVRVDSE
jgi:DNA polymerase-3 subunit gamma/tau